MKSSTATLILVILGVTAVAHGEVYTALAHMKELIILEKNLLELLEDYIETHPDMPEKFKDFVEEVKDHTSYIKGDEEAFLGHPMNAFLLVRRFRGTWTQLGKYLDKYDVDSGNIYYINTYVE